MAELAEYASTMAEQVQALLGSGWIEGVKEGVQNRIAAMTALGGQLGDSIDRQQDLLQRIDGAVARFDEFLPSANGPEDRDRSWAASNFVVSLSNLHTAIGSSVARSSFAHRGTWALRNMSERHAAGLRDQHRDDLLLGLTGDWNAGVSGQAIAAEIVRLSALERPDGVDDRDMLRDDELAGLLDLVNEGWGLVDAIQPGSGGQDGSAGMAEWLGLSFDPSYVADPNADGSGAPDYDWSSVDLAAMHDANQRVCKDASSADRLAYVGLTFIFCIGGDHPQPLLQAIDAHPDCYSGTVQVRSARIGAGTMVVTGVPGEQQDNVRWAISQFSRKDVEFT